VLAPAEVVPPLIDDPDAPPLALAEPAEPPEASRPSLGRDPSAQPVRLEEPPRTTRIMAFRRFFMPLAVLGMASARNSITRASLAKERRASGMPLARSVPREQVVSEKEVFMGFRVRLGAWRPSSVISESRFSAVKGSPWSLRIVLFAAAVALVAETAPPTYQYPFKKTVVGPETALTAETPYVRYRVTVDATGVAPNGRPTTAGASAGVEGQISMTGIDEAPAIAVSVSPDGVTPQAELSAYTSFELSAPIAFEGSCNKPSRSSPCTSTFYVDFARDDGGERGGSANVSFHLVLTSSVEKDDEPSAKTREPPWTVEIVRE
jgi:hypothetical protein